MSTLTPGPPIAPTIPGNFPRPTMTFGEFNPPNAEFCRVKQMQYCHGRCIHAESECCPDGSQCPVDDDRHCAIYTHTSLTKYGCCEKNYIFMRANTTEDGSYTCCKEGMKICGFRCVSAEESCCGHRGISCRKGETCYKTDHGTESCCLKGYKCESNGKMTQLDSSEDEKNDEDDDAASSAQSSRLTVSGTKVHPDPTDSAKPNTATTFYDNHKLLGGAISTSVIASLIFFLIL